MAAAGVADLGEALQFEVRRIEISFEARTADAGPSHPPDGPIWLLVPARRSWWQRLADRLRRWFRHPAKPPTQVRIVAERGAEPRILIEHNDPTQKETEHDQ